MSRYRSLPILLCLCLLATPVRAADEITAPFLQWQQNMDIWLQEIKQTLLREMPDIQLPPRNGPGSDWWQRPRMPYQPLPDEGKVMACLKDLSLCYEQYKPDLMRKCEHDSDTLSCLRLGVLANESNHPQEAVNPLRQACGMASDTPFPMPNSAAYYAANACAILGRLAEQAGDMVTANQYYDLSCTKGNPVACLMGEGNEGL